MKEKQALLTFSKMGALRSRFESFWRAVRRSWMIWPKEGRCLGTGSQQVLRNSTKRVGQSEGMGGWRCWEPIWKIKAIGSRPWKGTCLVKISQNTIPKLQMSTFSLQCSPRMISGHIVAGVPAKVLTNKMKTLQNETKGEKEKALGERLTFLLCGPETSRCQNRWSSARHPQRRECLLSSGLGERQDDRPHFPWAREKKRKIKEGVSADHEIWRKEGKK